MKIYISFGQCHSHAVNGKTFDRNCLCEIECEEHGDGREIAFANFGDKFFTSYDEAQLPEIIHHFPRGVVPL